MPNPISFTPGKRKHGRKRREVVAAPVPAALAVVSVEIVYEDPTDVHLYVFFNTSEDAPLVDSEEWLPGKWWVRRSNVRFNGGNVVWIDFNCLEVMVQAGDADEGDDGLYYDNAPSDVSDTLGRQLAAFEGFPL